MKKDGNFILSKNISYKAIDLYHLYISKINILIRNL